MNFTYQTAKIAVPADFGRDPAFSEAMRAEMAGLEADLTESFRDHMHGPRFGPGRAEYEAIMAPVWRKQRLVAHVRSLMPGKRAGRFVREWSCTAEDHPADFFCRECGERACCCRCVFCAHCGGTV